MLMGRCLIQALGLIDLLDGSAHAILDVIKPEASILNEVQASIRQAKCEFMYRLFVNPVVQGFHQGLIDVPVSPPVRKAPMTYDLSGDLSFGIKSA